MLAKPSLTLKRRIKAPPAQVFNAWTDPEKIVRWFGPAETISGSVRAALDVRVGSLSQDGDGTLLTCPTGPGL